jgi:hypothetical protein
MVGSSRYAPNVADAPKSFFYRHLGSKLHILSLTFFSKRVLIKQKHATDASIFLSLGISVVDRLLFDADLDPAFNIVAYADPT